jgi:hypothetical protein
MLRTYLPIYRIGLQLEELRYPAELRRGTVSAAEELTSWNTDPLNVFLKMVQQECRDHGLIYTSELAGRILEKPPKTYGEMLSELDHIDGLIGSELAKEGIVRIPPERTGHFEQAELFGPEVSKAFPSCARDIERAGSCYALGQEDACVYHCMLVLERGLNALATKLGVPYLNLNWQNIIDGITAKLKTLQKGPELEFYRGINAQFGFLKDAYRNHSQHARDDPYDMPKAHSILNHSRAFMQELAKGGLAE